MPETETDPEKPHRESAHPEKSSEEKKFPRGLVIRLFAYLVAGHLFAGFLYLLFTLGGQQ
ncbi:DUF6126 family protein [Streptomyces sp. NBC_01020]|uniref:DUF6126 family protein n=1 Tax=unclassified Streptomyces TaxID=2593676 RepID=UPI00224EDFF7|nr:MULTISPECIES: DUF6126 family protein [unclassified Streptomyces]MCX4722579.1 DUF6126 family protein [Streptomyces sp. NBC_01306]WSV07768.1 DUF6126 family protein [Streptomyces sp. NBC_01020]WSX45863.1 DUF6126 family protein [Streptomyces sp. NBC_00963]WSX66068.1 DUF6126 family protein [Streptomyces sp. NBC_00932]